MRLIEFQKRDDATGGAAARVSATSGSTSLLPSPPPGAGSFASTHWSVVLAAAEGDIPSAGTALEQLCRAYWKPLFVFARGLGYTEHDAQDLNQGFFEQFLR